MSDPTNAELELEFYERFFFSKNLEPYPVQEQAFEKIFAGESLLVTVPTGTGKTLMAKAALYKAWKLGQTAVYTTPLRALTEEKYRELCDDFGEDSVGFATGDYKVNPEAPIQVIVAEILWNRIFGAARDERTGHAPQLVDVVVMDEGHYFNDPERGYVWEQSIIGLAPRTQLVILSATVGDADQFCQWVYLTRGIPMALVESKERKVPLYHEFRESYLIDVVRELAETGQTPAIIFGFSREQCFDRARVVKSCRRFLSDEERARAAALVEPVLFDRGLGKDLKALLLHGIGIHHAGILPRYKQLVELLTLEKLCKFVVSTETISAGINLPAKRVVFPELRKAIRGKPRLLTSAEYHQMSGRAGRPQFDTEGIAITLAPEEVVQEIRKELKDSGTGRFAKSEEAIKKTAYTRARAEAQKNADITWSPDTHAALVSGKPAPLRSQTKVSAEQILAIGLPDLASAGDLAVVHAAPIPSLDAPAPAAAPPTAPAEPHLPPYMNLNIATVIDNLLLDERARLQSKNLLKQIVENLQALEVLDEHGQQIAGKMIGELRGIDGTFVYYFLSAHDPTYEESRELCEFLVDHEAIHRVLSRAGEDKKRAWIKERLRDRRRGEESQVSWEDVEEEYDRLFPRELSTTEKIHQEFSAKVPHPELHGGKTQKSIWVQFDEKELSFMDFVEEHGLSHEEGSLFTYLARVMKTAKMLAEVTGLEAFGDIEARVRNVLAEIDPRVLGEG